MEYTRYTDPLAIEISGEDGMPPILIALSIEERGRLESTAFLSLLERSLGASRSLSTLPASAYVGALRWERRLAVRRPEPGRLLRSICIVWREVCRRSLLLQARESQCKAVSATGHDALR